MRDNVIIETSALSKSYNGKTAVDSLTMQIQKGSVFGFLGPNGAGKTTTIRMLLGLAKPTSGVAMVQGQDVTRRHSATTSVGAMVEQPAFFDYLTGQENLKLFGFAAGMILTKIEIERLGERVGLSKSLNVKAGRYSLGMKQRLSIGLAMVGDPPLLFLDEPTNGLDPEGAQEIRALLRELRDDGKTIFLSTHLLAEMERVCTHIGIINGGKLNLTGKLTDLLPSGSTSFRVGSVERALELFPNAAEVRPGWINLKVEQNDIPSITRRLVSGGIDLFEVTQNSTSLEDLYFRATALSTRSDH